MFYLLGLINSQRSTSKSSAIRVSVIKSGCCTLVHHFETVEGTLPNFSASHLLVRFFSTRTIFSLFISFIRHIVDLYAKIVIFSESIYVPMN